MYQQKVPKKDKQETSSYTIHASSVNGTPLQILSSLTCGYVNTVSIDPATDNCGFRIETWIGGQYPKTIYVDKVKFDRDERNDGTLGLVSSVIKYLNQFKEQFKHVHIFALERQMAINYNAIRVAYTMISYFTNLIYSGEMLSEAQFIVEINPQLKGKILGAPKGCDKRTLKQWAVDYTLSDVRISNDVLLWNKINELRKKDDICDTYVQLRAFFKLIGFDGVRGCTYIMDSL